MSDPKQTIAEKERQKLLDTRDKTLVEPVPKSQAILDWLEQLFDGSGSFPEKIECRVVRGRDFATLGVMVKQIVYPPKTPKPSREELVSLSNQLVYVMQRDADIQRKSVVYGIFAYHFSRDPEFYDRHLHRCNNSPLHAGDGVPRPDEDEHEARPAIAEQFAVQAMGHQERMFALYGGGFEGMMDRFDRMLERYDQRVEKVEGRNEKLSDMLERALSMEEDRREKREWQQLKIRSAEKGLDFALGILPPLLNQISGKQLVATNDSMEAVTLRKLFIKVQDGGQLKEEEAIAAFGSDDGKPGALSMAQTKVLWDVGHCKQPVDVIDQLLPGGPLEIRQEQLMALVNIFGMERLMPIQMIVADRMRRRGGA